MLPLVRGDAAWEEMFQALAAYKDRFGNCNVRTHWEENPQLGQWCGSQRTDYKNAKLSRERIKRLEELGFVWDAYAEFWEGMFQALAAFKDRFGDCNIHQRWEENPQLGSWCKNQRTAYKNGKLTNDRRERLEGLGFEWNPRRKSSK